MSLINDALKRAQEARQNNPPSDAPPLRPVEFPARNGAGWLLATAAVFLLAAACFLIGIALFGHKTPPAAIAAKPASNMPVTAESAPATHAGPLQAEAPPPPATNAAPPPAEVALATNASLPPNLIKDPPPPPNAGPQPSVQGIIFNSGQPLAIINGKTLNVGDRVGNFQVKQVLKNGVVFQCPDGSEKTLGIGE